jgi:hypothetical protein
MSPQFAAGLTAFAGLCMVAGWFAAFRNRSYLGLLGLAFLTLSSFLWVGGKAQDLGVHKHQMLLLARVLFAVCLLFFLLAGLAALRETARRMRDIRDSYRAAEEAMLEIMQASREKESKPDAETAGADDPGPENRGVPDPHQERSPRE